MQGLKPAFSSTQQWEQLADALNNSSNFSTTVTSSAWPYSIEDFEELLDNMQFSQKENILFAQKVLRKLLQVALTNNQKELCYTDENENQYVIKKTEEKISFVKQFPSTLECSQITLFEYGIQELKQAIYAALQNNQNFQSNPALCKLLENNQPTLLQLAQKIGYNKDTLFPLSLVKSSRAYVWHAEYAGYCYQKPYFPSFIPFFTPKYHPANIPSVALQEFCRSGQLPDSAQEKCQLALEHCMRCADFFYRPTTDYLRYILKDLKQLNFLFNESLSYSHIQLKVWKELGEFIGKHFTGNSVNFSGLNFDDLKSPKIDNPLLALSRNPFLTSISFENSSCIARYAEDLTLLFAKSPSLTELNFIQCNLNDKSAVHLSALFATNTQIKVVNLQNNLFTVEDALLLITNSNLTSLNLENAIFKHVNSSWEWWPSLDPVGYRNHLKKLNISPIPPDAADYTSLLGALKENTNLTSFQLSHWPTPIMQNQCQYYLTCNLHTNLYQNHRLLPYSEGGSSLPREILELIFQIGMEAIKKGR